MVNNGLDNTFGSLSDPTRRDILQRLLPGKLTISELAKAYDMSLPAVSKHLKVLEAAQLITRERKGRQQFIRLQTDRFQDAADHLLYYQTVLNKRLDSLDTYLQKGRQTTTHTLRSKGKKLSTQTLTMTHIFNKSPKEVWEAYTNPRHVSEWWGPQGSEVLSCYNDVRVGGTWRFVFQGAENQDYIASGRYRSVVPFERLVYTDGFGEADDARPEAVVTVVFEALPDGKTKLTKTSVASKTTHQLQAAWLKATRNVEE